MNKYADLAPSRNAKKRAIMHRMLGAAKGCLRKIPYETEAQATTAAAEMSSKYSCLMKQYHCPHCHKWHLAKEKK